MVHLIPLLLSLPLIQADNPPPRLQAEHPAYEFRVGEMSGYVRPIGHHHGLIIHGHQNKPVTKQTMCTMNLEHYVSAEGHGQFVPRKVELQSYKVEGQTVTIDFAPTEEWKVRSSLQYDFTPVDFIDVTFTFRFDADYRSFEAFVASYMQSRVPPLVKTGGLWLRLQPERAWQMFLCKTREHAALVTDGRWGWFPPSLQSKVVDGVYDLPILVTRDDDTGYALIQLADPRECMAVSPNTFAPAHDLSFMGHDVSAGDVVTVPVRIHYMKIDSMEPVEALYRQFCKDRGIPVE